MKTQTIEELLERSLSIPYLFVGSGISRRYLGLPDWEGLLQYLASLISENSYAKYENIVRSSHPNYTFNEIMTSICDYIEKDLNDIWFDHPKFSETRSKYKHFVSNCSPLKIEIHNYLNEISQATDNYLLKNEVDILKTITMKSISGIITTNYDCFLENIFTDFKKYYNQDELLFSVSDGFGEIYKIHGCCEYPQTMAITSHDYKNIKEKNKYLAAKLLTIFVDHPIIFLGYSLEDEDVKNILEDILRCLNQEQINILKDRMIFVQRNEDIEEYTISESLYNFPSLGKTLRMTTIELNDFSLLYSALSQKKYKYPVNILKRLKSDLHQLIMTNDPECKMKVLLDSNNNLSSDIEYVMGAGTIKLSEVAYKSFESEDIYEDLVLNDKHFDPIQIILYTFPLLLKNNNYLPMHKYLKSIEITDIPPVVLKKLESKKDFSDFRNKSLKKIYEKNPNRTLNDILESREGSDAFKFNAICALSEEEFDLNKIEEFLEDYLTENPKCLTEGKYKSILKKIIQIYDWKKYAN